MRPTDISSWEPRLALPPDLECRKKKTWPISGSLSNKLFWMRGLTPEFWMTLVW